MPINVSTKTKFQPDPHWAKVPHGIWMREATSVAVDKNDNVFVFNRGNKPVLVFNQLGEVIDMWGNDNPPTRSELFETLMGMHLSSGTHGSIVHML